MVGPLRVPRLPYGPNGSRLHQVSIKKLFLLCLCMAFGLMMATGFLVQLRFKQFENETAELNAFLDAVASLTNLDQTTRGYLLDPDYEAREELHRQAAAISQALTRVKFKTIRARRLVREILRRTNRVGFVFDELHAPPASGDTPGQANLNRLKLVSGLYTEYGQMRFIIRKAIVAQRLDIEKSRRTIFFSILLLSATAAGLMLGLSLFVTKSVISRVDMLYQGMRTITGGNFEHRIRIRRQDEIGRLAMGFNEMTARLQSSYTALREEVRQRRQAEESQRLLNAELEDRVRDRTLDLAAANRQLRAEIEERRQAEARAESATKVKSDFLAKMSHEIRTPMNGILGMTELILLTTTDPKARKHLDMIKQSGQALLDIINDILDLSKIEAGKTELEHQVFNPRDIVASTVELLDVTARNKGLRLTFRLDDRVPGHAIGDEGRLRQILTNIIGNAVKFTEQGSVEVSATLAEDGSPLSPDTVHLLFSVKDTGIGIPGDKLESVFESFSQVGESSHVEYGGTGLGLAISKQLVEMMGGRIWVESEPVAGSTFFFTVRLGLVAEPRQSAGMARTTTAPGVSPLRILLAEDNEINRIYAVTLLEHMGHGVTAVDNGRKALEALKSERFDLVLIDVRMPVMDGGEATRLIRAGEAGNPEVPIVAMTAYALDGDRERFLAMGMDDYIAKPIDIDKLEQLLQRVALGRMMPGVRGE